MVSVTAEKLKAFPSSSERRALRPLDRRRARCVKRAEDLIIGVPLLVASLPFQAAAAIAVVVDSRGPVLFRQKRVGKAGRLVDMVKFRSMCVDAEERLLDDPALLEAYRANGFKVPSHHDHRVTRVGRHLRRTSLDELPQLWCVVRGTMSLVGPRPITAEELHHRFGGDSDVYMSTKPGLTGPWQVAGRSLVRADERTQMEIDYIERWSVRHDVAILLRTVPAVLTGRGAH
jgi:lipopolysaccharide/colanic/teichoic acid biosynthesis glycosyltransferase